MAAYSYLIAESYDLHERICARFRLAGALHDVGKSLLPSELFTKSAGLSAAERQLVETHTQEGYQLLTKAGHPGLETAGLVAKQHHENVDGSGYPAGLIGDAITLAARVVRVADTFDAVTSHRAYQAAKPEAEALDLLERGRHKHFDSSVLDAFLKGMRRYPAAPKRLTWLTADYVGPSDLGLESGEFFGTEDDSPDVSAKGWAPDWGAALAWETRRLD